MDESAYDEMAKLEESYWWFVARRKIIEMLVMRLSQGKKMRILEVGCGTGGNLKMLAKHGQGIAMEMNETAMGYAKKKEVFEFEIRQGSLPENLNLDSEDKFELICLLDVLEHIREDKYSLEKLAKHVENDGSILVTVPSFQWLWSEHDNVNHHQRRYSRTSLEALFTSAGFRVVYMSYFNSLLFPLALIERFFSRLKRHSHTTEIPEISKISNSFLKEVFQLESYMLRKMRFPIGLSIIAIIQPVQN